MSKDAIGGLENILREKRKRLERERSRILNENNGGSLKYKSKSHLAGFVIDNLLRNFDEKTFNEMDREDILVQKQRTEEL